VAVGHLSRASCVGPGTAAPASSGGRLLRLAQRGASYLSLLGLAPPGYSRGWRLGGWLPRAVCHVAERFSQCAPRALRVPVHTSGWGGPRGRCLLDAARCAGARCRGVGRFRVGFGIGRLGELFGEAVVFGAGGVEVGFCPLGADAQGVAGFFQGGDAGVGGVGELVECVLVVGEDAGGSRRLRRPGRARLG
jgi:hypothetical protein